VTNVPSVRENTGDRGFAIQIAKKRHAQFEIIDNQSPPTRATNHFVSGHYNYDSPSRTRPWLCHESLSPMTNLVTGGSGLSRASLGN